MLKKLGTTTRLCYIEIHVIMRCVIKGLHCIKYDESTIIRLFMKLDLKINKNCENISSLKAYPFSVVVLRSEESACLAAM